MRNSPAFARITLSIALLGALVGCRAMGEREQVARGGVAAAFDGTGGEWIDLTHPFNRATIYWPTDTLGFAHDKVSVGKTPGGWFYSAYRYSAAEHGGTHIDAPIHFAEGRLTVDEIPVSELVGPAAVVDVSDHAGADYLVSVGDFTDWEKKNGPIPDGAILLVRTGWDRKYGDRAAYLGTSRTGPAAVAELHFPGLDPAAAQWLVDHRKIKAFGLDTPSIDYGQSKVFRTHVILLGRNIPGLENVANLERLPPVGSFVVAMPMKIEAGSGAPLRLAAFVPRPTR